MEERALLAFEHKLARISLSLLQLHILCDFSHHSRYSTINSSTYSGLLTVVQGNFSLLGRFYETNRNLCSNLITLFCSETT